MTKKINGFIYWTPRILSILFIFLLALLSLDVFELNLNFGQTIIGLFMHNIPTLIMLIILIVSWKYEIVGGISFLLVGLLYTIFIVMRPSITWDTAMSMSLTVAVPTFLIGILFIINWLKKRK